VTAWPYIVLKKDGGRWTLYARRGPDEGDSEVIDLCAESESVSVALHWASELDALKEAKP
jgi:hypothetical protein